MRMPAACNIFTIRTMPSRLGRTPRVEIVVIQLRVRRGFARKRTNSFTSSSPSPMAFTHVVGRYEPSLSMTSFTTSRACTRPAYLPATVAICCRNRSVCASREFGLPCSS